MGWIEKIFGLPFYWAPVWEWVTGLGNILIGFARAEYRPEQDVTVGVIGLGWVGLDLFGLMQLRFGY